MYFRSGFKPTEYNETIWEVRKKMELSKAFKVPSAPFQLINFKRSQLEFDRPEILRRFP